MVLYEYKKNIKYQLYPKSTKWTYSNKKYLNIKKIFNITILVIKIGRLINRVSADYLNTK